MPVVYSANNVKLFLEQLLISMGILGLSKLVGEVASSAIRESEIRNYFGRKIAIDVSMSLYQFLVALRDEGGNQLTNEKGEIVSHLTGMFYS